MSIGKLDMCCSLKLTSKKRKKKRQQSKTFHSLLQRDAAHLFAFKLWLQAKVVSVRTITSNVEKVERNFLSSPSCQRLTNSEFALKTCRRREEAANNNIREVHMRLLHHCVQFSISSLLLPLSLSSVLSLNFCLNTCRRPRTL